MCETDYSGYPDCRNDTLKALQVALGLGLDRRICIERRSCGSTRRRLGRWRTSWAGSRSSTLSSETHTCYLGERGGAHAWGYG
jgi:7-cyano-7-deazaguanine synthase